ncbi:ATPase, T2SS/T4P/T4SS family [Achromobacter aloeverae]
MPSLTSLAFVDMILGRDFCVLKNLGGTAGVQPAPADCAEDIQRLRDLCSSMRSNGPEFITRLGDAKFRVTEQIEESGHPVWFLSRTGAQVLELAQLPLPRNVIEVVLRPGLTGLVLVSGGFGAGKTTNAASLFCARVEKLGGTGIAFEDPGAELDMGGQHGAGWIIPVPVSRFEGGYQEPLQRARRSRADHIFIGEIRDAQTAREVLNIAVADLPVITTLHSATIEEALETFQNYCLTSTASSAEINSRLSRNISAVIHLTRDPAAGGSGQAASFVPRCLVVDTDTVRAKIRAGDYTALNDEIASQAAHRAFHSSGSSPRPWSI